MSQWSCKVNPRKCKLKHNGNVDLISADYNLNMTLLLVKSGTTKSSFKWHLSWISSDDVNLYTAVKTNSMLLFKTVNRQVPKLIYREKFAYTSSIHRHCRAHNTISSFRDHALRHLSRVSGIWVLFYGIVCQSRLSRRLV